MSDPEQTTPSADILCGACGAPVVQPADATCPACGVLLAAYLAPSGSLGASDATPTPVAAMSPGDPSATRSLPSPAVVEEPGGDAPSFASPPLTTPPFQTSPMHRPTSQSPIGDALRRSGSAPDPRKSDAAGEDDLSKMADGNDELADMASGVDELAEMAAGGKTSLARQIEAELAGAKVTFEGARPVIDAEHVEIRQTTGGAPPVVASKVEGGAETPVGGRSVGKPAAVARQPTRQSATRGRYGQPVSIPVVPSTDATHQPASTRGGRPVESGTVVRWLPFILIGLFIFAFGSSLPGMGGVVGFVIVVVLIYLLLKWTVASGRKTTTMPRDERWNRKKRR